MAWWDFTVYVPQLAKMSYGITVYVAAFLRPHKLNTNPHKPSLDIFFSEERYKVLFWSG